ESVDLTQQDRRVEDDAVADHAGFLRVQDPRGDQVELELLAFAHDRVAGVVAALEAHDHLSPLREQIGDLPLPLVAPLGTDYDYARHKRWIVTGMGRWRVAREGHDFRHQNLTSCAPRVRSFRPRSGDGINRLHT